MKNKYFNASHLPVLFLFIAGGGNLYWSLKFDERIPTQQAKFVQLQNSMQSVDCPTINKGAVLLIAQGNVKDGENFATILLWEGVAFIFTAIVSFITAVKINNPKVESTNQGLK
ncbi:hypothetical protein [Sideroxydans sp. CL21]|uniref:hypothetical protein n=1 Tax=Sideroxydans sp. CL21 TaxID=2600596 RepID=UPI0024BC6BB0|nr:hypothetical protein [Sideroxydans sp. CL21]